MSNAESLGDSLPDAPVPVLRSRRRALMGAAAVGGVAIAAGTVGAGIASASNGGGWRREPMSFDVACLGHWFRGAQPLFKSDDGDFRMPFHVEGWIYPRGTVSDGFVPTEAESIGRWFCSGWFMTSGDRAEPHNNSTQRYVMGRMSEDQLFPDDVLVSEGLEGVHRLVATCASSCNWWNRPILRRVRRHDTNNYG